MQPLARHRPLGDQAEATPVSFCCPEVPLQTENILAQTDKCFLNLKVVKSHDGASLLEFPLLLPDMSHSCSG